MPCAEEHQHSASCDHSNDDPNRGTETSLYNQIDLDSIRCYNAVDESKCPKIFKSYDDRFDFTIELESDSDEQILIYVPFISNIKLKSIGILGVPSFLPSHLKAFINKVFFELIKDDLDFDSASSSVPTQEWELVSDFQNGIKLLNRDRPRVQHQANKFPKCS